MSVPRDTPAFRVTPHPLPPHRARHGANFFADLNRSLLVDFTSVRSTDTTDSPQRPRRAGQLIQSYPDVAQWEGPPGPCMIRD